jgi:nicotinamidase-related amidase
MLCSRLNHTFPHRRGDDGRRETRKLDRGAASGQNMQKKIPAAADSLWKAHSSRGGRSSQLDDEVGKLERRG